MAIVGILVPAGILLGGVAAVWTGFTSNGFDGSNAGAEPLALCEGAGVTTVNACVGSNGIIAPAPTDCLVCDMSRHPVELPFHQAAHLGLEWVLFAAAIL